MDKSMDHLEKLLKDFAGAAPESAGKIPKVMEFKPISVSIKFAVYTESNLAENNFIPAEVIGISPIGFCFMSPLRLFPKSKISFFGRGGKRFSGAAEILSSKKENSAYLTQATFIYIDIGKGSPIRRFPRQAVKRPFSIQVQRGGLSYSAQLLDISKVGLRFFCRYHVKTGDLVFTNSLGQDNSDTRVLRIVWTRSCKNGVEVGAEFFQG